MMTIGAFLRNMAVLLALMAALSAVETLLPFSTKKWRGRHMPPNIALTAITLCLNLALNASSVLVTAWLNERHAGVLAGIGLSPGTQIALGIVVLDASTYAAHRLMHVIPSLWRAHSVHHSDPLVDVSTALRFHPIETVWRFAFVILPTWFLGLSPQAVAAWRVASAFMAVVEHMNVKLWRPLDSALSLVFCTPNMHTLHQSRIESETNTNYGNIFSAFDRVTGAFTPSERATDLDSGLVGYDDVDTQRFGGLLRLPFASVAEPSTLSARSDPRCRSAS
jgi:sterol desaturase/sphingolipid hydroxylase (fatty acid hydroxylase superfamily)